MLLWSFRACKFLQWFLSLSKNQIQEIGNAESVILTEFISFLTILLTGFYFRLSSLLLMQSSQFSLLSILTFNIFFSFPFSLSLPFKVELTHKQKDRQGHRDRQTFFRVRRGWRHFCWTWTKNKTEEIHVGAEMIDCRL